MCVSARLANLTTDASNKRTADMLDQRYSALDQEMEEIGKMWTNAKADLARYTKEQVCGCVLCCYCLFIRVRMLLLFLVCCCLLLFLFTLYCCVVFACLLVCCYMLLFAVFVDNNCFMHIQ